MPPSLFGHSMNFVKFDLFAHLFQRCTYTFKHLAILLVISFILVSRTGRWSTLHCMWCNVVWPSLIIIDCSFRLSGLVGQLDWNIGCNQITNQPTIGATIDWNWPTAIDLCLFQLSVIIIMIVVYISSYNLHYYLFKLD